MFKFADPNSAPPKMYNYEKRSCKLSEKDAYMELDQKKKCDNIESFGAIRSFSQNSQGLNIP